MACGAYQGAFRVAVGRSALGTAGADVGRGRRDRWRPRRRRSAEGRQRRCRPAERRRTKGRVEHLQLSASARSLKMIALFIASAMFGVVSGPVVSLFLPAETPPWVGW